VIVHKTIKGVFSMFNKKMLLVAAATVAFVAAPVSAFAKHHHKDVNCYGVNGCKGKSACKTAKNACKGKNSCKGQGVMKETAKHCKKMGGTTKEPKE
jgi:hypothetical protein